AEGPGDPFLAHPPPLRAGQPPGRAGRPPRWRGGLLRPRHPNPGPAPVDPWTRRRPVSGDEPVPRRVAERGGVAGRGVGHSGVLERPALERRRGRAPVAPPGRGP